jgi:hypothetical protein
MEDEDGAIVFARMDWTCLLERLIIWKAQSLTCHSYQSFE